MFAKSIVAVAMLASCVVAQTTANSTIDPSTVDATTRSQWCAGELNTCGTLCSGAVNTNTCNDTVLTFSCTCASNNSQPGLQYYLETLPTFICIQIFQNCITAGENDAAAQALCTKNKDANCGTLNPDNFTAAAATTTSSSTSTSATGSSSATGTNAAVTSTSSKAAAAAATMMAAAGNYGTGALAMGVAAAFGFML